MTKVTKNAKKYQKCQKITKKAENAKMPKMAKMLKIAFQIPAWVTRPDRPKSAKDKVPSPEGPLTKSLHFYYIHISRHFSFFLFIDTLFFFPFLDTLYFFLFLDTLVFFIDPLFPWNMIHKVAEEAFFILLLLCHFPSEHLLPICNFPFTRPNITVSKKLWKNIFFGENSFHKLTVKYMFFIDAIP